MAVPDVIHRGPPNALNGVCWTIAVVDWLFSVVQPAQVLLPLSIFDWYAVNSAATPTAGK